MKNIKNRLKPLLKKNGFFALLCVLPVVVLLISSVFAPLKDRIFSAGFEYKKGEEAKTKDVVDNALNKLVKPVPQPQSNQNSAPAGEPGDLALFLDKEKLLIKRRIELFDAQRELQAKGVAGVQAERALLETELAQVQKAIEEERKRIDEDKKKEAAERAGRFTLSDGFNVNSNRIVWGAFTNVYVALLFVAIAVGFWVIIDVGPESPLSKVLAVVGAIFVGGTAVYFAKQINPYWDVPGLVSALMQDHWWQVLGVKEKSEWGILFVGIFLSFACGALIWGLPPLEQAAGKKQEDKARDIKKTHREFLRRAKFLRLLLFIAAAVLVAKVFQSDAFFTWSESYFNFGDAAEGFKSLKRGLILQEAINYTLFLAAFYIPAFLFFRLGSDKFSETYAKQILDEVDEEKRDQLKEQVTNLSIWKLLPRLVAIIAPVLATPVVGLLTEAFKG